ncbi:hypothetical protein EDF46_3190 [Frondihabitans sp. PhB188]|uniref:hypothetical protein n=1 Tax=Frondihabitans sp. PhB188 TaxID=2485200 RepID=UPI000F472682|nr:hypothetical protein [Frondihabitans sp. PhB188]ROQ36647.1 hypothetical protein EDF46_3190 [Frondihabitans sp. PhB188]
MSDLTDTRPTTSRLALRLLRHDRRVAILGVAFVALGYLAITGFATITIPWIGTGDSYDHLDYVYQVTLGHLPQPNGHQWTPGNYPGEGAIGRQYASAHPPFYYFLMSLLAGQQLVDGHWHVAVEMIRLANAFFGLVGLVTTAFFGWMIGGRLRVRLAIGLPAVATATFSYLRFSSDVYNDLLVTALSLIALTLATRTLMRGPSWRVTPFLAVVGALAIGTKATYVLTLGVVAVAIVAAALVHPAGRSIGRSIGRMIGHLAVIGAAPIAAFGWYFVANYLRSGDWYRSSVQTAIGERSNRTLMDNLTDPSFYLIVPQGLVGRGPAAFVETAQAWSMVIFFAAFAVTLIVTVVALVRRSFRWSTVRVLIVIMLLGHLAGSYLLQLSHSIGYGAYNWRYFLPSTISIGLVLGIGVIAIGRRSGAIAAPALVIALWVTNCISFVTYSLVRGDVPKTGQGLVKDAGALAFANGFPGWTPAALLAVAAIGILGVGVVLWRYREAPLPTDEAVADAPAAARAD